MVCDYFVLECVCFVPQKKLHDDVLKIDKHFETKKRKFLEDSEKFRRELKRVSEVGRDMAKGSRVRHHIVRDCPYSLAIVLAWDGGMKYASVGKLV